MPLWDFKCNQCGFTDEYLCYNKKDDPTDCPKCKGKMEKQMSRQFSFDIIGYCYMNEYGKHAWKKNLSSSQQIDVLTGVKDPY